MHLNNIRWGNGARLVVFVGVWQSVCLCHPVFCFTSTECHYKTGWPLSVGIDPGAGPKNSFQDGRIWKDFLLRPSCFTKTTLCNFTSLTADTLSLLQPWNENQTFSYSKTSQVLSWSMFWGWYKIHNPMVWYQTCVLRIGKIYTLEKSSKLDCVSERFAEEIIISSAKCFKVMLRLKKNLK